MIVYLKVLSCLGLKYAYALYDKTETRYWLVTMMYFEKFVARRSNYAMYILLLLEALASYN